MRHLNAESIGAILVGRASEALVSDVMISQETNRLKRWIKEAVKIRRRSNNTITSPETIHGCGGVAHSTGSDGPVRWASLIRRLKD